MIELRAVRFDDPAVVAALPPDGSDSAYRRILKHGNVQLLAQGDQPLGGFVFNDPDLSLICRADLLSGEGTSKTVAPASPAARLAALYRAHGDDFPRALRGTFAVIIYDRLRDTIKAWTDHFGAQRLVYTSSPLLTGISTDLRLLLRITREEPVIDPLAIQEYVQYSCITAPRTIYKGFSRLSAGHQLIVNRLGVEARRYWDLAYSPASQHKSEEAWAAETFEAVRSAVSRTTTGLQDRDTLGCFLSGGTDSSSIAGLVGEVTGRPPKTFSIGFDHPRYNEMHYARLAADRHKTDHHEYFVKAGDILSLLDKAAQAYDEPFGNSSIIPTYYCARLAAENGVTHMLAGDGGDELFGGNARYVEDRVFQRYHSIPAPVRRGVIEPLVAFGSALTSHSLPRKASSYINRSNISMPDRVFSYSFLSSVPSSELFTNDFAGMVSGSSPLATARKHFNSASAPDDLNRWLYLDLQITISDNDLRKVTVMSQTAGITTRYPLLDPTLAEFAGTLPPQLKVRKSELRYIFKKAMSPVLPQQIITKSKHGFGLPYSIWVNEDRRLHDFTFDILGSRECRNRGYFRSDLLEWIWKQYETVSQTYFGDVLWIFLMLELWHLEAQHSSVPERVSGGSLKAGA